MSNTTNSSGAMNFTTVKMDELFEQGVSSFEKGLNVVGNFANQIADTFGTESRRNVGYQYPGMGVQPNGYMRQAPVTYGYGYGTTGNFDQFGNFVQSSHSFNMGGDVCDGFWNPSYGKGVY